MEYSPVVLTTDNTDVKQFSETVVIQLNINSVTNRKDKSSSVSQFINAVILNTNAYLFDQRKKSEKRNHN